MKQLIMSIIKFIMKKLNAHKLKKKNESERETHKNYLKKEFIECLTHDFTLSLTRFSSIRVIN